MNTRKDNKEPRPVRRIVTKTMHRARRPVRRARAAAYRLADSLRKRLPVSSKKKQDTQRYNELVKRFSLDREPI